jgi:hypothetical protein
MRRRTRFQVRSQQNVTSADRSIVLLESSRLSVYNSDISRNHIPMTASRALVEDSASLIRSSGLDVAELQFGIVALRTGLWSRSPSVPILSSQDLHIRALVEKARRKRIRSAGGLLRGRPFVCANQSEALFAGSEEGCTGVRCRAHVAFDHVLIRWATSKDATTDCAEQ